MTAIVNPAASANGSKFLEAVSETFSSYFTVTCDPVCDPIEFGGVELFGTTGPLTDEQIDDFYEIVRCEVEVELFNYAHREGYTTTREMIDAEVSHSGNGIETTADRRNALTFVFDGAMVP